MDTCIYSRRLLQIMDIIVNTDGFVTVGVIAKKLHVSNRTVIRELKDTEYIFSRFDLVLTAKKGTGYKIDGDEQKKEAFNAYIESSLKNLVANSPDLRRERLLLECLQRKQIDKLSYFAYLFNVSEGTISNDLKIIEEWLQAQNLTIKRGQTSGIELIGSEENIHRAKANFLHDQLVKEDVEEYIHNNAKFDELEYFKRASDNENSIMNLLNRDILFSVITTLRDISVILLNNITRSSYLGLIIHMTIAIDRIKKGESIEMAPEIFDKLKHDPLFALANEFAHYFEMNQNITFPQEEVAYILMHLKGTRIRVPQQDATELEDVETEHDCTRIVEQLILNFSKLADYDYTADEDLFAGLMAHLKPALNRISYNLSIRNPLLSQIKGQYGEMFDLTKETCAFIKDNKGECISDHEIGYLTLHFGAAVERAKALLQNENKLNVGVICSSGVGISVLLVSTIRSSFHQLGEVRALSVEQLHDSEEMKQIDVIVTTLTIEYPSLPIVQVNPLLEPQDIDCLTRMFQQVRVEKRLKGIKAFHCSEQKETMDMHILDDTRLVQFMFPLTRGQTIHNLIRILDEPSSVRKECIRAITEREKLGEVKLEDKEFVLYHASLASIRKPYIVFFRFNNYAHMTDSKEKIAVGLMILLPKPAKKAERITLGNISYRILQDDRLLETVRLGTQQDIIDYLKESMAMENLL